MCKENKIFISIYKDVSDEEATFFPMEELPQIDEPTLCWRAH
jgi:hypothetical protein